MLSILKCCIKALLRNFNGRTDGAVLDARLFDLMVQCAAVPTRPMTVKKWRGGKAVLPDVTLEVLARVFGADCAFIIQKVHDWMSYNESRGKQTHYIDGRWWTYNSVGEWQRAHFGWMSEDTVGRKIRGLVADGIFVEGIYGQRGDRRRWLSINYEVLAQKAIPQNPSMPPAKSKYASADCGSTPRKLQIVAADCGTTKSESNGLNPQLDKLKTSTNELTVVVVATGLQSNEEKDFINQEGRERHDGQDEPTQAGTAVLREMIALGIGAEAARDLLALGEDQARAGIAYTKMQAARGKIKDKTAYAIEAIRQGWRVPLSPYPPPPKAVENKSYIGGEYADFIHHG